MTCARLAPTGALLLLAACSAAPAPLGADARFDPSKIADAAEAIDAAGVARHVEALASDAFEGRAPATPGEERTVAYLADRLRELGLAPGNPDGTYVQEVPLVGFRATPRGGLETPKGAIELAFPTDAVALTRRFVTEASLDAPLVFAGHGVVAPEHGWDDFAGVDVRGKTIVVLVGDPPVADPADPSKLDARLFKGRAMTYYGRWTYKYEIAAEKGAAGVLIVHEEGPAGYPWGVVAGSWGGREAFDVDRPDGNARRAAVEGWITRDVAKRLFSECGLDFEAEKRAAAKRGFRARELPAKARISVANELRRVVSRNVVARLPGGDPRRLDEHVVYTAHWDHLGVDPAAAGDGIYNGAVDNATGCAALLEIAEAYLRLRARPPRSILFLAVTAEEKGLLGSKHYATNPLWPIEGTIAVVNMDGMNPWGRTRDVVSVGLGHSTLDDTLAKVAAAHGRVVVPDPEPEKGLFFRSDHFEFVKRGVPALDADSGTDFVGKPAGWGRDVRDRYTAQDYHKPSDEVKPDWDYSGLVEDARLLFEFGCRVAAADRRPSWKQESEFASLRASDDGSP